MTRTDFGGAPPLRLATLGPGLLALGLALAGCSDDTPRAGSVDVAASRKAAESQGKVNPFGPGSRTGDVAATRVKAGRKAPRLVKFGQAKKGSR